MNDINDLDKLVAFKAELLEDLKRIAASDDKSLDEIMNLSYLLEMVQECINRKEQTS